MPRIADTPNMSLVREVYDTAAEQGPQILITRFDDWFAPDFEWTPILLSSIDGRAYRGKREFEDYWEQFREAFADIELSEGSFEEIDYDKVLLTARLRVTGVGSGVPIDREVAYLFEVRDGRIAFARTFFSPRDAREFLARA